ncbi:helix-turn-helix transcriptional regulator [Flavobacterium sp. MC2016-06]|jgi:transcriptional regulator with XRE-family HTH domain|uniref:helix-turn-helix domain-containing protein n=1 Tax=Flavobacterium sp. MC2016-06 TaxID=2676308 RepID=UPI0012BADDDD|nr:helix-turn-helix transcriptional regulator [Flavobacterium sp. MC2016-06]MBU3860786.1 helix-turn-helix domain-containing protein [Flavobacterium sp. MC2016-06]
MMYNEKLVRFFKSKGLKQKEVGEILGFSPAMIGRYLHGTAGIGPEFLMSLNKNFPELDLNDLFLDESSNSNKANNLRDNYETSLLSDVNDIEVRLKKVKEKLLRQIKVE